MDRLSDEILTTVTDRAAILARIDVLERETCAALLRGVTSADQYKSINNIKAQQHAEARVFADPAPEP